MRWLANIVWRWVERMAPEAASDCIHAKALEIQLGWQRTNERKPALTENQLVRLRELVAGAPVLPPISAPDWTEECRAEWARFLDTAAGQALWQRFAAVEYLTMRQAVKSGAAADAPARAGGFAEARAYLESLSRASLRDIEDEGTSRPEGEPGIRERFTP